MNDREINVAIAEACGWTKTQKEGWGFSAPMMFPAHEKDGKTVFDSELPDFCKDLNAMHKAFEYLRKTDEHAFGCMTDMLETVVGRGPLWHATARQRAEAFLRTIGNWKEVV